jgi:hypothetical protein
VLKSSWKEFKMLKRSLVVLLLLAPWLGGFSCNTADKYRTSTPMLGVVQLGPFPKTGPGVAGYYLYLSKSKDGPYEKIDGGPVGGGQSILVPMLNPGQDYYFKMTSVSDKDPNKESPQSAAFKRTAAAKKN